MGESRVFCTPISTSIKVSSSYLVLPSSYGTRSFLDRSSASLSTTTSTKRRPGPCRDRPRRGRLLRQRRLRQRLLSELLRQRRRPSRSPPPPPLPPRSWNRRCRRKSSRSRTPPARRPSHPDRVWPSASTGRESTGRGSVLSSFFSPPFVLLSSSSSVLHTHTHTHTQLVIFFLADGRRDRVDRQRFVAVHKRTRPHCVLAHLCCFIGFGFCRRSSGPTDRVFSASSSSGCPFFSSHRVRLVEAKHFRRDVCVALSDLVSHQRSHYLDFTSLEYLIM